MSGHGKPDDAAVRKAKDMAQQTFGKLIGDDDARSRAATDLKRRANGPAGKAPPEDGSSRD